MKMKALASQLKKEGKKVISFTVGEPDFQTPKHIVDACIDALNAGMTKYIDAPGLPELREAIAEKSKNENNIQCEAANVFVAPTKHALFESVFATVNPGDEVLIPDPAWVSYVPFVSMADGKAVPVPLLEEASFRMTPEQVAEKITPKSKVIMMNSPSNPCGSVNTEADIKGIADLAKDHDLIVITDEVYEKIIFDGMKHLSIASLPGMFERTITINGFSKTYSMTGWRLGWLVADKPYLKGISKIQQHTITHAPTFIQKAGVAALKGPQEPVNKMIDEFKKRRDIVYKYIQETSGASAPQPKGAFYAFMKFDADMTDEEMAMYLMKDAEVVVTPGDSFGAAGKKHVRISFATATSDVEKGMAGIKAALEKL
ncbi:MAG: pyridoxal phosphate-dependent aminotransferase [Thermoplasmata archaeon]|nr:pyridoxal phosphate-dependent aminotransferase [Thermoplasmata archaeon]